MSDVTAGDSKPKVRVERQGASMSGVTAGDSKPKVRVERQGASMSGVTAGDSKPKVRVERQGAGMSGVTAGDSKPKVRVERQGASMSGVTADSVSGMPRSLARLSAIASRRRMRPATASLVMTGSERAPSSSREACLCSSRSLPACSR